jgi:histidinol phosphatase-like enzyme (inositol monophosphatase family)
MSKQTQTRFLKNALRVAQDIAIASSNITLKYFRQGVTASAKHDNSPVTIADKHCEEFIRKQLHKHFPTHSIVGEEFGKDYSDTSFQWFIDPVDGTRNFIRGLPFWGTLIGLEVEGEVAAGVAHFPLLNTTLIASKGGGCFNNKKQLHVSSVRKIENATLSFGTLRGLLKQQQAPAFLNIVRQAYHNIGDCFGFMYVIMGNVDSASGMIEPSAHPWDLAPIKICIEEAGGRLTDYQGRKTIHGGNAVVTNGLLHKQVLRMLNGM